MHLEPIAHNKAETCFCKMSRLIHKADAPTKFIADFEKSLTRTLLSEYNSIAERAVKAGLKAYKGKSTKGQAKSVEKAVTKEMLKFGSDSLNSTVEENMATFYEEVTVRFVKEHGLKLEKAAQGADLNIDFTLQDKEAIAATQRVTVQTAGRYFPDQLQGKTSEVIQRVVLESGLPIKEAAKVLEAEIRGALGVQAGDVIPTQFASNPQAYFEIVSANASVQATSLGRMIAMSDAGIEKYRVQAILDRRTSAICRGLDGKEFTVGGTMKGVERFFGVETLTDLENLLPFSNDGSTPGWASDGLGFPPYHHSCRTTVVPVF